MVSRRDILRAVLIVGSVSLVVEAGLAVRSYLQTKNAGPELNAFLNKPVVEITSPTIDDTFEVGEAINVDVYAISQTALITSIELQIDGALAEVQAAPGAGRSPFSVPFAFAVSEPGSHTLLASAVDNIGFEAYSIPLQIEVAENEGAEPAQFFSSGIGPVVLSTGSALPTPTPSPLTPDPGNAPPPVNSWTLSVGNWLFPQQKKLALTAPEISSQVEKCSVELFIQDFTENEQGFAVYRQVEFIPGWVKIATFSPIFGGLKGFTDEHPPAGPANVSYYVEAFNKYQTAPSNVVHVTIVPDPDCSTFYEGPPGFTVEMANLTINQPVDSAYCYRSFDETSWHRWPESGFFIPNENGSIDTASTPLLFFDETFDGEKLSTEISVSLDCWGWRDGEIIALGKFTQFGIDPSISQTFLPGNGNILPKIDLKNVVNLPKFSQANLPFYSVHMSFDPDDCFSHIIPYNSPQAKAACAPQVGYHEGPEGVAPQPYLIWDIEDLKCKAGSGPNACIKWQKWVEWWAKLELSGRSNSMVWFITDTHGPGAFIDNPMRWAYAVPPPNRECKTTRAFLLSLYVDTLAIVQGPTVFTTIPCADVQSKKESGFYGVEVNLSQLVLNSVNDGPLDHDIEVTGRISIYLECVGLPAVSANKDWHCYDFLFKPVRPLFHGLGGTGSTAWYLVHSVSLSATLGNDTYPMANLQLRNPATDQIVSPISVIDVPIERAPRMVISLYLEDHDSLSNDDVACDRQEVTGTYNIADMEWWPKVDNFHVSVHSPANGTAACWLDVYLTTVK